MTLEQWVTLSQLFQGLGSVLTVLVTLYIAIIVQKYTIKKDKFDIFRFIWGEQQAINVAMLNSGDSLSVFEKIVYGDNHVVDKETSQKYCLLFIVINGLQHFFYSYKNELMSKEELDLCCLPTARMLKREENTVSYLLTERGYSPEFSEYLKCLIADASPSMPPTPLKATTIRTFIIERLRRH